MQRAPRRTRTLVRVRVRVRVGVGVRVRVQVRVRVREVELLLQRVYVVDDDGRRSWLGLGLGSVVSGTG